MFTHMIRHPDALYSNDLVFMFGVGVKPNCHGGGEGRLCDRCVELNQQLLRQVKLPELSLVYK